MGFFGFVGSVLSKAAPIVAVFNPAIGAAMAGAGKLATMAEGDATVGQVAQVGQSAVADYRQAEEQAQRQEDERKASEPPPLFGQESTFDVSGGVPITTSP